MTVGGVAFSVTLILVLLGLYLGWQIQMTRFLGAIPADLWVGQRGARTLSHSISILPTSLQTRLEETTGAEVSDFLGRQSSFTINGQDTQLYLIAADQLVGPYRTLEGKSIPDQGELVVDQSFLVKQKLKLGDVIQHHDGDFTISGVMTGANLLVYSYALVNRGDLVKMFDIKDYTNYFLLQTPDPAAAKTLIEQQFPDLEVMTKQEWLENNAELVTQTFLPIIAVLLIIALAIGTAVIGLTIFTATIEKSREYGVLKAIGYGSASLYAIALIQALFAGVIGYLVGYIATLLTVKITTSLVSAFIYEISPVQVAAVLLVVLGMSVFASLIPLKRLASIDPALVFKA